VATALTKEKTMGDRNQGQDRSTILPLTHTLADTLNRLPKLQARSKSALAEYERCQAERQRQTLVDMIAKDMGRRYSVQRSSLKHFEIFHPAQTEVVKMLQVLDLPALVAEGAGIIFFGPVGTGKDHLCAAMLYRAASNHGIRGQWINGQDWFGTMRDRIDQGRAESEILRSLTVPTILAISDPIPARREPSPWNVEMLYRLVDQRYRNLRSTWVTLNVESPEEADDKLSAPVFDRLRESAVFAKCFWPSFRERKRG
jgi:DNA replication protein DnaC